MKHAQPRGLSRRRVEKLLYQVKSYRSPASRIDFLSRSFLGLPYTQNPLVGSSQEPEVFTASLDGFDCVTYIETVLALSNAANAEDFVRNLRNIRYADGRIAWERRNHYMTSWIRNNGRHGMLRMVNPKQLPSIVKTRTLDLLPGLRPIRQTFSCIPKKHIGKLDSYLQTGDLIFFASTRAHNDIFHCGVLARTENGLVMRHAARSRDKVVEQELNEFLKSNRMAGVIVVRPVDGKGTGA